MGGGDGPGGEGSAEGLAAGGDGVVRVVLKFRRCDLQKTSGGGKIRLLFSAQ